jgi:hypothetical protein
LSVIYLIRIFNHIIAKPLKTVLPAEQHVEPVAAFLVLHQQVELELPVPETVLQARRLKARVCVG